MLFLACGLDLGKLAEQPRLYRGLTIGLLGAWPSLTWDAIHRNPQRDYEMRPFRSWQLHATCSGMACCAWKSVDENLSCEMLCKPSRDEQTNTPVVLV